MESEAELIAAIARLAQWADDGVKMAAAPLRALLTQIPYDQIVSLAKSPCPQSLGPGYHDLDPSAQDS